MTDTLLYDGFVKIERADNGHEVVRATDSVAILIFVVDLKILLFVRQYRPAMIHPLYCPTGMFLELPAGRMDRPGLTFRQLAVAETYEETGVTITEDEVMFIDDEPQALCPGLSTERTAIAYVEITSDRMEPDRIFGTDEHEKIHRVLVLEQDLPHLRLKSMTSKAAIRWFRLMRLGKL